MSDNKKVWIFTFGVGSENRYKLVKIHGTYGEARAKMIKKYGTKWAFQHSEKEWNEWIAEGKDYFIGRYEMEVIE